MHKSYAAICLISTRKVPRHGLDFRVTASLKSQCTGTVLIPRLMTRIAGHGFLPKLEADSGKSLPSREVARERHRLVSSDYVGLESAYHMHIQWYLKPQDSTRRL